MANPIPRGLYAITSSDLIAPEQLVQAVAQAIQGGAVMIQYRDKSADPGRRLWEAGDLANLCHSLNVPLIINDDIALAKAVGAHGVHLGREDGAIEAARAELGSKAIIGVSCYNQWPLAGQAQAAGADYVAFGRFFPSRTKPDAVQAELELLYRCRQELTIPAVAIGGITPENGVQLVEAGAHALAVIDGVFGAADIAAQAQRYRHLYE